MVQPEGPRSVFRSYSGEKFIPTEEISLGSSDYGEIIKVLGRRGSDNEVVYSIKDTSTEIRGFDYVNEQGMHGFEVLLASSPIPETDFSHVRRGQAVFQTLEQDCRTQGIQVLTTTCIPRLARVACSPAYGFQPSGRDDAKRMLASSRGDKSARSVSLFKMLQ